MSSSDVEIAGFGNSDSEPDTPRQVYVTPTSPGPARATLTSILRLFSSTKKLITLESSRLAEEVIEVSECLKNWSGPWANSPAS